MYWTRFTSVAHNAIVSKGEMDGSNPTNLVTNLGEARGIQIDIKTKRLYWTNPKSKSIESSNLNGTACVTVHQLEYGPYGIALFHERLYWGYGGVSNSIESGGIQAGGHRRIEHTGKALTRHFTVPIWNQGGSRPNNCKGIDCSGVCVLTRTAFRCVRKLNNL